jgi:amidase
MAFPEYSNFDGLGLADLVRRKKVSPAELVEEAISRIEAHNPKLNAVVLPLYERAREKAKGKLPDGPFTGVPFMIKDLHATLEGVPTSHGNKLWRNVPASITTELVKRWEDSSDPGRKTNTPEFGLALYQIGYSRSGTEPVDTRRTTGGFSGDQPPRWLLEWCHSLGWDGGGSIRIPSALAVFLD